MAKIAFEDKVALNEEPSIAEKNKVTDGNMNEIKTSVNDLYDTVSDNTADIGTNTSDISTLNTKVGNIGSYTVATGQYTTATWAFGTNTCTWTAPTSGVYLIYMKISTNNSTVGLPYKQIQIQGTSTKLLGTNLLFFQQATQSGYGAIQGLVLTAPISATAGQTVIPYVHTDVANNVWDVTIVGIKLS